MSHTGSPAKSSENFRMKLRLITLEVRDVGEEGRASPLTPETEASGVRDGAQPRTKVDLPAPAAAAAAAAASAAAVALGSGFVDVQRATAELGAVDAADSRLGGRGVRHLDAGEAP